MVIQSAIFIDGVLPALFYYLSLAYFHLLKYCMQYADSMH